MIIVAPFLVRMLGFGFATAIAFYPFILVKNESLKSNKVLINHERIHLKQQLEMLIIPFYLWYFMEYAIRRFQFKGHYAAYRHISFEMEAYNNEHELNYLKNRSLWAWFSSFRN